ncbi:MAG: glycosyltransferase family 2 protein [Syntrophales bacterium]|jgi:GT2 family glycosyltransferase
MVDISIIIVSWNAKGLLEKCLDSISNISNRYRSETIVVDNASTDGAPELVKNKFPEVKLIQNAVNLGFARANNIGITEGVGRYICLINSDVVVPEHCLDHMCEYMDANLEIGVLAPKVLNPDGTLQYTCREFPSFWNNLCRAFALDTTFPRSSIFGRQFMTYWSHDKVSDVDYVSGCFMLVRKSALEQVGLLDEEFFFYAEDKDWCKRFWDAGWHVVYDPLVQVYHHNAGSSSKDPVKFYIEEIRANLQYYKKHHNQLSKMAFILTTILHQQLRILGSLISLVLKPQVKNETRDNLKRSVSALQWVLRIN